MSDPVPSPFNLILSSSSPSPTYPPSPPSPSSPPYPPSPTSPPSPPSPPSSPPPPSPLPATMNSVRSRPMSRVYCKVVRMILLMKLLMKTCKIGWMLGS